MIGAIENNAFFGLRQLTALKLTQCSLQEMPPLDPVKDTLKELRLNINNLATIHPAYFHGFTRLTKLDLSENELCTFPELSPVSQSLMLVRVWWNRISSLGLFATNSTFPRLSSLGLGTNKIYELKLNCEMILRLPRLRYLDVSNNLLTTLDDLSGLTHGEQIRVGLFNTLRPGQNSCHFPDDILNAFS